MSYIGKWFGKLLSGNNRHPVGQTDAEVCHQLQQARSYLMSGELEKAARLGLEAFQQAGKSNPSVSEYALSLLVFIWMEQEVYETATDFFSRYIAENRPNPSALRNRAMSYWYAGRLTEAHADFESARAYCRTIR